MQGVDIDKIHGTRVKLDDEVCPVCKKNNIETRGWEYQHNKPIDNAVCLNCLSTFSFVYELKRITNIVKGDNENQI